MIRNNRRRWRKFEIGAACILHYHNLKIRACLIVAMLLFVQNYRAATPRACRRITRNTGWWGLVWRNYDKERFKKTFRVSRDTFEFILENIQPKLERQTVCGDPISPEFRLGLCLHRLGRGDYFHTIAKMAGLAPCTVSTIVSDVNEAIVGCLWNESTSAHMPKTDEEFKEKKNTEECWQFPFSWCVVDGCHIPIKCPPGGPEACKEYHNFKNFFSIVLMAMVDSKYRFVWGSCGFPGNSHDSMIFQSTSLWSSIKEGKVLPNFTQDQNGISIPPVILGDSAFPLETLLMKLYTNAVLIKEQKYFNYRLSRARMVVEGAFGQLGNSLLWILEKLKNESLNVHQ